MLGWPWFEFPLWFSFSFDVLEVAALTSIAAFGAIPALKCFAEMIAFKTVYKKEGVVGIGGIFAGSGVEFPLG